MNKSRFIYIFFLLISVPAPAQNCKEPVRKS